MPPYVSVPFINPCPIPTIDGLCVRPSYVYKRMPLEFLELPERQWVWSENENDAFSICPDHWKKESLHDALDALELKIALKSMDSLDSLESMAAQLKIASDMKSI